MKNETKTFGKCPGCKKKTPWEGNKWRPFCSERCKTLDLGAWASGDYKIPDELDEFDEEAADINLKNGGLN